MFFVRLADWLCVCFGCDEFAVWFVFYVLIWLVFLLCRELPFCLCFGYFSFNWLILFVCLWFASVFGTIFMFGEKGQKSRWFQFCIWKIDMNKDGCLKSLTSSEACLLCVCIVMSADILWKIEVRCSSCSDM